MIVVVKSEHRRDLLRLYCTWLRGRNGATPAVDAYPPETRTEAGFTRFEVLEDEFISELECSGIPFERA